jgi:hypothetical protein
MNGGHGVASGGTICTITGPAVGTDRGHGAAGACGRGSGEQP